MKNVISTFLKTWTNRPSKDSQISGEISMTVADGYYAVIFTSTLNDDDPAYDAMAKAMYKLAQQQPGFLHMESARSELGITVSYWQSLDAISAWRNAAQHQLAQKLGKEKWYKSYTTRICKVEREYSFEANA